MPLPPDTLEDLLGTVALLCLLSVAFGTVMRLARGDRAGRSVLGALFGGAAVLAMLDPLTVAPGVIMDLRNLPVAMAGAYLGPSGALAAVGLAAAARLGIGGAGAAAGVAALALSALAGLLWARLAGPSGRQRGGRALLGLGALSQAHWLGAFLLPDGTAWGFLAGTVPAFAPVEVLGALLVGTCLERERALLAEARRLERETEEDALTGLLNRRGFERRVAEARTGREPGEGAGGALLLADIDHFKQVNDRHGHAAGDDVLRAIGPRLRSALGSEAILGRLGGEEIAIFLPGRDAWQAEATGRRLGQAVRAAGFAAAGGTVEVTISLGGARAWPSSSFEALLARADAALYEAKDAGRDRCRFAPEALPGRPAPPAPGPVRLPAAVEVGRAA